MLWLAIHLPQLSLEAFCATLPAAVRQPPVALLAADHRVHSVNAAAAACGVRPGIKRATALALAPELLIAQSSDPRDAAALLALAHAALAFTPVVTLHDAQTVLLDVQASLRLFGGLAALQRRLADAVAPLQHRLHWAAAPTPLGAALLAQWHPQSSAAAEKIDLVCGPHATRLALLQRLLADAPVWLLGPGREHWEALQGMGLRQLSDLRQMPRSGLGRRFGPLLQDELDRALGHQPDPRQWVVLPETFSSRLELFARAETTEQVLHGAAVLLARLVAWAQARHARVAAFTLRMLHDSRRGSATPATDLRIELAQPALAPAHLQLLLRERLARLQLLAPTLELQLDCSEVVAGHAPNGELFPSRGSAAEGLTRLLERLRARLGETQVQRLAEVADHRPERASRTLPLGPAPAAAFGALAGGAIAGPHDGCALPLHRPTWLLPEPLPLAERNALPLLQGRPLQLLSGPERIEAGWWDADPVTRDYYIAQAEDGSLAWVFRSRLPQAVDEVSWYLQGRFG